MQGAHSTGKLRGEPGRVNIVSRIRDYHGLTYGATSATGLANFWKGFEPLAPGFPARTRPRSLPLLGRRVSRRGLRQGAGGCSPKGTSRFGGRRRRGAGAGRRWRDRAAGGLLPAPASGLRQVRLLLIADEVTQQISASVELDAGL